MKEFIFRISFVLISASCSTESIRLKPYDCGPLARDDLGVVFGAGKPASRQTYFVKGKAGDICPKLMSAESISGFETDYCANYEPKDKKECGVIKVFTITEYQSGPST